MIAQGTWYVVSASDPRWNGSGRCCCGGFVKPKEVDKHLTERKDTLKSEPPEDTAWGYMKD